MAESIDRTIYKLEIDDSGYSAGVDRMEGSTKRLVEIQNAANKALKVLEEALKSQSDFLQKAKRDLEAYSGADETYRKQLTQTFKTAQQENLKLNNLVIQARKEYDLATKAAKDFADISAKATNLQNRTTGGKIPTGPQPGVAAGLSAQIFNTVNLTDFAELAEITARTTQEFDELRDSITLAEERMKQLNEQDDEFRALSSIVDAGKKALADYDTVTKQAAGSTTSLRTQIRLGRDELVRLEEAGKGTSQEYIELEKNVARLTDAFQDQQQRIRILASDTRLLDFGKAAITSAISAFQVYTSVAILAGQENEELQKKTMQLFAAMQLLTSLEQLSNQVRRGGVIITNLQSAAQATYTAVVGASTGALRALRIALLATGIGAAVIGIGFLITKLVEARNAQDDVADSSKKLSDVMEEAKDSFVEATKNVNELRLEIEAAKSGFIDKDAVVKHYNETIGKTTGEVKNLNEAEQALAKNAQAYIQFTLLKAAANIALGKAAQSAFEVQEAINNATITDVRRSTVAAISRDLAIKQARENGKTQAEAIQAGRDAFNKALGQDLAGTAAREQEQFQAIAESLFKQSTEIAERFGFNFLQRTEKNKATIQNEFEKKKAELDERLAALTRKEAEDENKIRIEFAARLAKEQLEIERLQKEKKITAPQAEILKAENIQINTLELQKALDDFNKRVTDARKKLNDEILDLQNKNTQDQLNLIQDEFDRRRQLIDFNEERELADAQAATEDRLAALEFDRLLIGEEAYQDAKADIISAGEQAALNIIRDAAAQRQDLAADTFSASLDALNQLFEDQLLTLDETTAAKIQAEKALFVQGTINYDEFQKRITKILRDEKAERDRLRLLELNAELNAINQRLDAVTDAEEKAELQKRQRSVRKQIADLNSETNDIVDPTKPIETVQAYVEAIGQLIDSTIAFWQKANEAEAAALDRSISLQEQRVSAAQRIAERGNASYLKAEEDRLKELQVIRENAARRDLAINAALQASQLLVGITGAIAKIATPGIGIAETIGAIAVIFAALATGYGLVKSLQGNQPRLFKGTKYLERNGQPSGRDTIPVWANEGEAWIPTETNKKYHPAISAIYDQSIPAETINQFVKTYHQVKGIPQVNHQRIKDTAEMSIGHDGRLSLLLSEQNRLITENNDLQRQTLRVFRTNKVNVSLDKNGFAVAQIEAIEQMKRDKKL